MEATIGNLVRNSTEFGLTVNGQKCKQWGPVSSQTALASLLPWDSGVIFLAVAVASQDFIQDYCRKVVFKLLGCLERLKLLGACIPISTSSAAVVQDDVSTPS